MTTKDVVFKIIPEGEYANPNTYCYFGWEGKGAFAFWKYATAYYDSAEILFEKFKASAGHNDILDSTGITMCFLYRHFVELTIKHLYVKFVCSSESDYKVFLEKGHDLYELWHATKPKLKELKARVGSSVDIGVLEHYIMEFDRFDKNSMMMRYPIDKKLKPTHTSTRLDIFNLHDRVNELYWAFFAIANDLDGQLFDEVEQGKVEVFLKRYDELRPRIQWLIEAMKPFAEKENTEIKFTSFSDLGANIEDDMKQMQLLGKCTDDELIMLDTLYYTGRYILNKQLRLPKNPHEAKTDAVKQCIINMEYDGLEFGKPKNSEVMICQMMASSIIRNVTATVKVIDWDK